MHILFITLNQVEKGTFFRVLGFAKELSSRGHKVTIIATSRKSKIKVKETRFENNILLVEMPDLFNGPLRSGWDLWNIINRIIWLRNKKFDLVHSFESRPTVIFPSLYLKKRKIPIIMDWADWFGKGGSVEERENPIVRFLLRPIETFFEEKFRTKADFHTVICTELRDKLVCLGVSINNILLIRNGVDLRTEIPINKIHAREILNIDKEMIIIGWLGSTFKKDAILMATAFEIISKQNSNVFLLIAGYFNHDIKKLFNNSKKIIETGFVDQEVLDYYLSSVDLFWLPLRNTKANRGRFPFKLTQYMMFGKPIVSSPVGDITDIFKKDKIGCLVPDNPEDYAINTMIILEQKETMVLMGQNARRLVERDFTWKVISNELEALYITLVERNNKL
ncbi:MAG: glycosyltransferase family 4 protein [Anaerolineaceae bacterium]|nr:glycosyltransferase family 4 protein [Anaerolineaceae bacterium]